MDCRALLTAFTKIRRERFKYVYVGIKGAVAYQKADRVRREVVKLKGDLRNEFMCVPVFC